MNLHTTFSNFYPEGSWQGECGDFAHKLVDFKSVGNSFSQKKKAVKDYGILKENLVTFHTGDVVITSDGTFMGFGHGHVLVVMNQDKDFIYAAESNYNLDGRVHYGRKIAKNDPKIYGVIRGNFRFLVNLSKPVLNVYFLMQYQKQWDSKCFGEVCDRIKTAFNGRLTINPIPLYTYKALKNWDYKIYGTGMGEMFSLVSQDYFNSTVMPLTNNAQAVIWCINKQQWEGSVLNHPETQEIGWYFRPSLPAQIELCCEEGDLSPIDPTKSLFNDGVFHELSHFFYTYGRADQVDNTHLHHLGQHNLEAIVPDIDLERLIVNL